VNQRLGKLVSANGCDGHQAPKYKKWFKAISLSPCPYRRPCPLTPPRHLADALNHGALGGAADPWSPTPSHRSSTVAADTSPSCLIPLPLPCVACPFQCALLECRHSTSPCRPAPVASPTMETRTDARTHRWMCVVRCVRRCSCVLQIMMWLGVRN
jgi:hypothetical protein